MIRAVVFDCDGVLVDSEPLAARAWAEAIAVYGYDITDADHDACLGITEDAMHGYLSERVDLPPYKAVIAEVDAIRFVLFDAHLAAFPDAVAAIRALALEGIPLAVASSSRRFALDRKLAMFDLARYFDAIVAGDQVAHGKPAPDVYREAAAGLGIEPKHCLAIEDARTGAESATAAGMRVVVVSRSGSLMPPYATVSSVDSFEIRSWMGLG
jgi:HAD superfamily hydrolase (TIGR01509 family)